MSPIEPRDPDVTAPIEGRLGPTQSMDVSETARMTIGRYDLLQKIGEGGMGEVWLAEQKEPVRRRVAVKLVKSGMSTREVIARFESERQVVALMDHPAITKVLDAGSTPQGAPYFVMEYVAGIPITAYCDKHNLSIRQRLELFMRVCDGVQHAHQKAIIHRDLKPSNVLVTEVDGRPAPKIIDFGVAKALTQKLTVDTIFTRLGALVGTPEYMSPEQANSSGEDIDTRTDVYSLGTILYELLAGSPPLDLRSVALDEFLQRLREEEPPKPSTRLRSHDQAVSSELARKRQTEPLMLARQIGGDLDSITLKALEKDRSRRYASPSDFAADIARYLNHEAVLAVHPSTVYRARKYVRRHRLAVASIAGVMLALTAGAVTALREAHIARERFNDVRTLANRFLFDFHDAIAGVEGTTKARELVVATALEYLRRLEKNAGNDPALEREVAGAYVKVAHAQGVPGEPNLGRTQDARESLQRAIEIYGRLGATTAGEVEQAIDPMELLARLEDDQDRNDVSLELYRRALAVAAKVPLERMTPSLATQYALLHIRMSGPLDQTGDSEAAYQEVRAGERILGQYGDGQPAGSFDRHPKLYLSYLQTAARRSGRLEEAMAAADEYLKKAGSSPSAQAFYDARVSEVYASVDEPSWDEPSKALPLVLRAVRNYEQRLTADPNDVNSKYSLAVNNSKIGYYLLKSNPAEAVRALEYTIALFESMVRESPNNTEFPGRLLRYRARMALARSYLHQKAEVEKIASQVLADKSPTGQDRLHLLNFCGLALANVGCRDAAAPILRDASQLAGELVAAPRSGMSLKIEATRAFEQHAGFLRQTGDVASASQLLEQARDLWQKQEPSTTYVKLARARAERLLAELRAR